MGELIKLGEFCRYLLEYESQRCADPVALGDIFREFYEIERTLTLKKTIYMIWSLGIDIEVADYLSTGGTNMRANGKWYIHYSAKDRPATQKFTVFHELFEVIHKSLAMLDSDISELKEPQLSQSADRFAAAALIPPKFFLSEVNSTGYDLVKMSTDLELSHQCLLIALGQHLGEIPFVGALYEYRPEADKGEPRTASIGNYLATVVVKTPQTRGVKQLCGLQTVPSRNSRPKAGSLVCSVITGGRPMLWQSTIPGDMPLILVRPLLSSGQEPYKVILLAVAGSEYNAISLQAEAIDTLFVDGDDWCPAQKKCGTVKDCIWKSNGG